MSVSTAVVSTSDVLSSLRSGRLSLCPVSLAAMPARGSRSAHLQCVLMLLLMSLCRIPNCPLLSCIVVVQPAILSMSKSHTYCSVQFALDGSSVVAKLGDTAVLAVIHGTLEEPRSQRYASTSLSSVSCQASAQGNTALEAGISCMQTSLPDGF